MSKMASFEEAVRIVCEKYNLKDLNTYQREALIDRICAEPKGCFR